MICCAAPSSPSSLPVPLGALEANTACNKRSPSTVRLVMEIPVLEDDPGTPCLDRFRARAICEFDRRFVPELPEELKADFINGVVKKSVGSLSVQDVVTIAGEDESFLRAEVQVPAGGVVSPLMLIQTMLADDLHERLVERAQLAAVA